MHCTGWNDQTVLNHVPCHSLSFGAPHISNSNIFRQGKVHSEIIKILICLVIKLLTSAAAECHLVPFFRCHHVSCSPLHLRRRVLM